MSIGTFDTHTLLGVTRVIPPVNTFWLDLCFPSVVTFDTEVIDFDLVDEGRRLAPFVSPLSQGKPMVQKGFTTRKFKPAYVKPKDNVDPRRLIKRLPGEAIGGDMSMEQRRLAVIADLLRVQRDAITRRMEWMAACCVLNDQVVVAGEDYPSQTITFGRATNQTLALTTTDAWDDASKTDVKGDLETWATRIHRASGYAPTTIVFGLEAWGTFCGKQQVKDELDTTRRASGATLNLIGEGMPQQYRGTFGPWECWTYNDFYLDNSEAAVSIMDEESIVMLNPRGFNGVRGYGAIMDPKAGYRAAEMWPKNFVAEDPPAEFVMTQSAPLPFPLQPNASMRIKVIDD